MMNKQSPKQYSQTPANTQKILLFEMSEIRGLEEELNRSTGQSQGLFVLPNQFWQNSDPILYLAIEGSWVKSRYL